MENEDLRGGENGDMEEVSQIWRRVVMGDLQSVEKDFQLNFERNR